MSIDVQKFAERLLPKAAIGPLAPVIKIADNVLNGQDDSATAQRMALIVFVVRVVSAVIAFASQVLLARWLGTFQYGIFVAVWVALLVAASTASVGFPSAVIRLIAEYRQRDQIPLLRGSIRSALLISTGCSIVFSALGAILLYFFPGFVSQYYVVPIYLALICLPVMCAEGVVDGTARAFNWTFIAFLPTFIMRPIGIIAIVGIAILLGFEPNAITAMWAGVISTTVTALFQLVISKIKLERTLPKVAPQFKLKEWGIIALPMFLVESFYMMQTSVDVLLVSYYMAPDDTAVYFASTKILALVHFVYFAVRASVAHRYTAFHASGDIIGFREFVQKTATWTFWPSLFLAVVMIITGKYILMLFGAEFVSGTYVVWILVIGVVIRASVGPAESLLVMADGQKICATIYAFALLVNVLLNVSFIPIFGLEGAALATTLALTFETAALHAAAKRKLGIHAFIIPERTIPEERTS